MKESSWLAVDDALDEVGGVALAVDGRDQSRGRLGHDDAVGAGILEGLGVLDQEQRAFFQQSESDFGVAPQRHHELGHVEQPAGQREGPDHAAEHHLVVEGLGGKTGGFQVLAGPARPDRPAPAAP